MKGTDWEWNWYRVPPVFPHGRSHSMQHHGSARSPNLLHHGRATFQLTVDVLRDDVTPLLTLVRRSAIKPTVK
jgi:hypothetical protein